MLEENNLGENKCQLNMNETHLIIPLGDGGFVTNKEIDKFCRNSFTSNSNDVEGVDHSFLASELEHSWVIGLDRNLLETYPNKADVLVIQNPDLKSNSSEPKYPVTYALSYVDQDKKTSDIWENPPLKEKTKTDWYSYSKSIFEVKDVLQYDTVQDLTKIWSKDLYKSEQINLNDLASEESKNDEGLPILTKDAVNTIKKSDELINENPHLIVNYYFPTVQTSETISSGSSIINSTKNITLNVGLIPEIESVNQNNFYFPKQKEKSNKITKSNSGNVNETEDRLDNANHKKNEEDSIDQVLNINNAKQYPKLKTELKNSSEFKSNINYSHKKEKKEKYSFSKGCSVLPEKSLPLKKKAKMKRTVILPWHEKTEMSFVDEAGSNQDGRSEMQMKLSSVSISQNYYSSSDSDEPLINKMKKDKRSVNSTSCNELCKEKESHQDKTLSFKKVMKSTESTLTANETNIKLFNETLCDNVNDNCKTIFDLVDDLKTTRFINSSLQQILHLGLKEMGTDILKEMRLKQKEKIAADNIAYSPQLKAFALMLYFKQPAAFNHLSKVYKKGWPSLSVIKDWKRRMNNQQKPVLKKMKKE